MILLRIVLWPFSFIYWVLTKFRNHLFDIGYSRSFHFETRVINVGNLRVGGTGKTPHVEYLIRLLKDRFKIATLSRGYGRETQGFILADTHATAKTIGDEPLQFYTKFSQDISVAVGEERALAIPTILFERPETEVIILDDAFQHRTVVPDLNILLTDYHHPFYEDIVLPAGRLRESRSGAKRADIVIVTKCPGDLPEQEQSTIIRKIRKYTLDKTPVFFTGIRYMKAQSCFSEYKDRFLESILLVTGIANSKPLYDEVKSKYQLEGTLNFKDHHDYTDKSIEMILKQFKEIGGNHKGVLTTEKDMVKLMAEPLKEKLAAIPLYYLPIEVYFLGGNEVFDTMVLECMQKKS